jgi:hypothetical protein
VQLLQAYKTVRALGLSHLVRLDDFTTRRYSGLLVVKDPGALLFWPGSLVLTLGVVLMLGRRYARVYVQAFPRTNGKSAQRQAATRKK